MTSGSELNRQSGVPGKKGWIVFAILAFMGMAVYFTLGDRVFPAASIDLKLSRNEVRQKAREYSSRFGYPVDKTIQSSSFTYYNEAKTFLEYELGLDKASELMRSEIPVWCWSSAFRRELSFEQMRVWFWPSGQLMGFSHDIEQERKLPTITHAVALDRARRFLSEQGVVLDHLALKSDQNVSKANREDHSFSFEDKTRDYKGGRIRYDVTISGDLLTDYSTYLKVPDAFTRKYDRMRSYNDLLQSIASIFYNTLTIISYLVVPWAISRKQMRYRVAIFGGILMAVIQLASSINDYDSVLESYDTTRPFRDFIITYYLQQLVEVGKNFLSGAITFGACDTVFRLVYPKRVALENYLGWRGFATREGQSAVILGTLLFAVHLGWIVFYYLIGERLNFWCPLGVENYQVLGSFLPALSALAIGVQAASAEETIARVVALSLFEKLTKRFWLANLMQAAAWGFMHSSYPQQPAYARGIELTLAGMLYGFVIKRYGVLPCIIGHYLVDAFLTAKPLLSADDPLLRLQGWMPLIVFALMALIGKIMGRLRGPVDEAAQTNQALPMPDAAIQPVEESREFDYAPFAPAKKWALAFIGLAGIVFAFCITPPEPGDNSRIRIDREQAIARGKEILAANNIDATGYQCLASLSNSTSETDYQYVNEKLGRKSANEMAKRVKEDYVWSLRFFKFLDPTVYAVRLNGGGKENSFDATMDDDAAVKSVDKAEAESIARAYVKKLYPHFADIKLDKISTDEKQARTDYRISFIVPSVKVGEASYIVAINVIGDRPCNVVESWQIPSSWHYERNKEPVYKNYLDVARSVVTGVIGLLVLIWGIGVLRTGGVKLRIPILAALLCAILNILEKVNHWPTFFAGYSSSTAMETYIFNSLTQRAAGLAPSVIKTFFILAFGLAAFKILSPRIDFITVLRTCFKPQGVKDRLTQEQLWLDGILIAVFWSGLTLTLSTTCDIIAYRFSPEIKVSSIWAITQLPGYLSPMASDLLELVPSLINSLMSAAILAGVFARYIPRPWIFIALVVPYQLLMASGARNVPDFAINSAQAIGANILYAFIVFRLAKFNPVAYLVKIVLDDALPYIWSIWVYAFPAMSSDFFELIVYGLSPVFIYLYLRTRNRKLKKLNASLESSAPPEAV